MSDAKKCDRCGAFYEGYRGKRHYIMEQNSEGYLDLCPVCSDSFESWLTLRPKEASDGKSEEEQSSGDDNI